jgi:hypothetical protein
VENIAQQTAAEYCHANFDTVEAPGPIVYCSGTVAGEPTADGSCVEELESEGEGPDEGMDGGHGWLENEWVEDSAIEVVNCLVRHEVSLVLTFQVYMMRRQHTNMPAIAQLPGGSCRQSSPSSCGRLNMMYNSVIKPGASIVNQAILPGILKRDSIDVFPMG